ncbi:hypothetical protein AHF37_12655, partial [Paragonimus kellicotti]
MLIEMGYAYDFQIVFSTSFWHSKNLHSLKPIDSTMV